MIETVANEARKEIAMTEMLQTDAYALYQQAFNYHQQGRWSEAQLIYERLYDTGYERDHLLFLMGSIALSQGNLDAAESLTKRSLANGVKNPGALNNLGAIAFYRKDFANALRYYSEAIDVAPHMADVYSNKGQILVAMNEHAEAFELFRKALELEPNHLSAMVNMGYAHVELNEHEKAIGWFVKVTSENPANIEAVLSEATCRLSMGDYEKGLKLFETRWGRAVNRPVRHSSQAPIWDGKEDLNGKRLLVWHEQGLGDTIQFSRYANLAAKAGAQVILEVQPELRTLFESFGDGTRIITRGEEVPDHQLQCSMMSLPLAFGTTVESIPSVATYLSAAAPKVNLWSARLGLKTKLRVGIIWRGNPSHVGDHSRSISLHQTSVLALPDIELVSLQKNVYPDERDFLRSHAIRFFDDDIQDFSDTAALVELMDVVISVDTSVAHLAGAMGRPVWILLPLNADWRWLRYRKDSPWYSSAQLFRQSQPGKWQSVLNEVVLRLQSYR